MCRKTNQNHHRKALIKRHRAGVRIDQFEVLERHTQWGLDLLDRYVKFVKERTEVEQAYAKQLR